MVQEGSLIKAQSRPEVYVIQNGQKRWIPDGATLTSQWDWGQLQTLSDADVAAIPWGEPIPSVMTGRQWPVDTLVEAPPDGHVYVVKEDQKRHWIPDPQTLLAAGFNWASIESISTELMNTIAVGDPLPSVLQRPGRVIVDTGEDQLGANSGHFMSTRAGLTIATGVLETVTRIRTITWFGGFHGGMYCILADDADLPVEPLPMQRLWVDGTMVGTSDQTQAWSPPPISPASAQNVRQIHVFHTWAPDSFQHVLDKWVAAGASVASLAGDVQAVAKLFTSSAGSAG